MYQINSDKQLVSFLKNILDIDLEKDLVFIKDVNFKYIYVNDIFCQLFNLKPEEIIGKTDSDFFSDKVALKNCYESDLSALKNSYILHEEKAFKRNFKVLKIKINLGNNKIGLLCFAK